VVQLDEEDKYLINTRIILDKYFNYQHILAYFFPGSW